MVRSSSTRMSLIPLSETTTSGWNCMPSCARDPSETLENPAPTDALITSHSSPVRTSSALFKAPPKEGSSRQPQQENPTLSPSRIARLTDLLRASFGSGPRQPQLLMVTGTHVPGLYRNPGVLRYAAQG